MNRNLTGDVIKFLRSEAEWLVALERVTDCPTARIGARHRLLRVRAFLAQVEKSAATQSQPTPEGEKLMAEWRKHDGGPNPSPGQPVDLYWGVGVIERQPSDKVNWSLPWTWRANPSPQPRSDKEGG